MSQIIGTSNWIVYPLNYNLILLEELSLEDVH